MKRKLSLIITGVLLLFLSLPLTAQNIPAMTGPVTDRAGVLSSSQEAEISRMILQLEAATSAQVAVLTVPDLQGYALEDFSYKTAKAWKLGQADRDNGVLVLMALAEKKVRIEVGYGLEGSLTDAKSGYIIRERILPAFRQGDYGQGLSLAVSSIAGVITAESDITEEQLAAYRKESSSGGSTIPFNLLFFLIILLFSFLRGLGGRGRRGGLARALFWGSVLGSSGRGRSGGFGGGGFSGGGFSGGGGSFGGGGASGGW